MAQLPKLTVAHLFFVLLFFWLTWMWESVSDYQNRKNFNERVEEFMASGDRFTREDGDLLKRRIRMLENTISVMEHHQEEHPDEQPAD